MSDYEPWWMSEEPAGPQPAAPAPTPAPRRGRVRALLTSATAAGTALVVAGAGAGVAAGHALWAGGSPAAAGSGAIQQLPLGGSGFGGSGPGFGGGFVQPGTGGSGSADGGQTGTGGPSDAAAIAQRVDPGVVDINTTLGYQQGEAAGTGMVLTGNGEVLTNNHVVEGATKISVTDIGNGRTYPANVVGYDRSHDVAVLQLVGAAGLQTVRIAGQPARMGQAVVAIGNAGGSGGTPSYAGGGVTALGQSITANDASDGSSEQLTGLIETDANVVPGDSGGPLVNTAGQVLGMDTAASQGFRFSGAGSQGYAIPIGTALSLARQIVAGQASDTVHIGPTAMLGVGVQPDGSGRFSAAPGALVTEVLQNGPAAAAGISAGDTITALAGQSVDSAQALTQAVMSQRPGQRVQVGYLDSSGQQHSVTVTLISGPPQ